MKEILALNEKILALGLEFPSDRGVDLSRDETSEEAGLLPAELQAEIESLQQAINAALPDDFDYYVFLAFPDIEVSFSLEFDRMPAGGSEDGTFLPERTLVEQLHEVNWEEQRAKASKVRRTMDDLLRLTELMTGSLRPAKALQREFREETRDFIKEKRVDATHIHVLYLDDEAEIMEAQFDDGAAFREALPGMLADRLELVTVVAGGKPLPVERIDALKVEAQKTLRARLETSAEAARQEKLAQGNTEAAGEPDDAALADQTERLAP